jgi:hypothetical protein
MEGPENVGNVGNDGIGPDDPEKAGFQTSFVDARTSETSAANVGAGHHLGASPPDDEAETWGEL